MFGAENKTTVPIKVTFNVGRSQNFVCNTASHVVERVVEPNKIEFLTHVRRDDLKEEMMLDFDVKIKET